jgi:hypothetical protein
MLYHEHEKLFRPIRGVLGYLRAGPRSFLFIFDKSSASQWAFMTPDRGMPGSSLQDMGKSREPEHAQTPMAKPPWGSR